MVQTVLSSRSLGSRLGMLAAAAVAALVVAPAQAQTFDAAAQFSTTNGNPNGVWAYGYSSGLAGTFNLYDTASTLSSFRTFRSSTSSNGTIPFVGVNDGPSVVLGTAAGQFAFHPGADTAHSNSVLRFIAPSTASYVLTSQFFVGDTSGGPNLGDTGVTVFRNGNTAAPLFSSASTNTSPTYNATLALNAGDIISFSIDPAADGFNYDTTPANIRFVQQAGGTVAGPEPASLALLLPAGLGVVGIVRRRRK